MDTELAIIERALAGDPANTKLRDERFNWLRRLSRTINVQGEEFELVTHEDGRRLLILDTHEIDYDTPLEAQITACEFYYEDRNITSENFPRPKDAKTSLKLFLLNLGCMASAEELELAFKQHQLLGTDPYQLLALSKRHPDLQGKFPTFALGSRWLNPVDGLVVPVLYWNSHGPHLHLSHYGGVWHSHWWFLVAR